MAPDRTRCAWCGTDPLYVRYHDEEWGVPVHDEHHLFELLTLEGAQAGLSWLTILRKREGYRKAFASFDPDKVARFTAARERMLLNDPSIVRNRLKVASTINNARATLDLRGAGSSLDELLWSFTDGATVHNRWRKPSDLPAETATSKAMSKELKRRGFRFIGPTVCYSLMQAAGIINNHVVDCFRHSKLAR